jgi:hypothetical protein
LASQITFFRSALGFGTAGLGVLDDDDCFGAGGGGGQFDAQRSGFHAHSVALLTEAASSGFVAITERHKQSLAGHDRYSDIWPGSLQLKAPVTKLPRR